MSIRNTKTRGKKIEAKVTKRIREIEPNTIESEQKKDELQRAYNNLKERFKQMTTELQVSLESLRNEITERERAEKALSEKSMYLNNILSSATEYAIATTDLDFRITYYNPMSEKIHGHKAEDVIGKTVMEIHTKEKVAPERFDQAVENVRRYGEHLYTVEKESEEGTHYIDTRISGIYDSKGELVGFANFAKDVTLQRKVDENIKKSGERYRRMTKQLLTIQDQERERISRDIHDSLGQYLATFAVQNGLIRKRLIDVNPALVKDIDEMNELLLEAIEECHRLSFELSPPALKELGLVQVLREVISGFKQRTGININFTETLAGKRLAPDKELALFRIQQEAFSNIMKHASASKIDIKLYRDKGNIHFNIVDNGQGFDTSELNQISRTGDKSVHGIGLLSMRERVRNCNGVFTIESKSGKETRIDVIIPEE